MKARRYPPSPRAILSQLLPLPLGLVHRASRSRTQTSVLLAGLLGQLLEVLLLAHLLLRLQLLLDLGSHLHLHHVREGVVTWLLGGSLQWLMSGSC